MTVKDLIQELLEYDTESEVEINIDVSPYEAEQFDFDVTESYEVTGRNRVHLTFELEEPLGHKEDE